MKSVSDIFEHFGGPKALADKIDKGVPFTTVASWESRGSIPISYWPRLIEISDGSLSCEFLMNIHAARASEKRGAR